MTSLVIRAVTVKDIPSIVKTRLAAVTEEEIRGFSAPEFATTSSTEELRKIWNTGNRLKDGFEDRRRRLTFNLSLENVETTNPKFVIYF